jgi:hypothetical protein
MDCRVRGGERPTVEINCHLRRSLQRIKRLRTTLGKARPSGSLIPYRYVFYLSQARGFAIRYVLRRTLSRLIYF